MQLVLANLCLAYGPLSGLIVNRMHWDELPQGLGNPSIVMHLISSVGGYTYQGRDGLERARVQFDCRGRTAAEARDVADALDARLDGFKGQFDGVLFQGAFREARQTRSDNDGADAWFTARTDYLIWWASA